MFACMIINNNLVFSNRFLFIALVPLLLESTLALRPDRLSLNSSSSSSETSLHDELLCTSVVENAALIQSYH